MPYRIGIGYDAHRLTTGRGLILGGVRVPFEKGLDGHSDADVLIHAVIDALLGAAALGDIGTHFPDGAPAYKNADSAELLAQVNILLKNAGYAVVNIDAVIVAQKPKLSPYYAEMVSNIARALRVPENFVSVKATTEEGMGFTGGGEGISAQAVCLIEKE